MSHKLEEVPVDARPPEQLTGLIGGSRAALFREALEAARERLAGRTVMNVNSTAVGGGVAEMMRPMLGYLRGAGIDARWGVIQGSGDFFRVTKRLHNALHGDGAGGPLGAHERAVYDDTTAANAPKLLTLAGRGDIAVLHDPQTAGLIAPLRAAGVRVVWRCHVGIDEPSLTREAAWDFLRPYLTEADAFVFSRASYAPPWIDPSRMWVIPPSIDPCSPKNRSIDRDTTRAILTHTGLVAGPRPSGPVTFERGDGTTGRLDRFADVIQTGPPPPYDVPLVVQVSRWDRLKDMRGVMQGFARHIAGCSTAHLTLVGPNVSGVADDPEGAEVLSDCIDHWRQLPHHERARIHLACIPTADVDENAIIVNAIQRHATVVVQKSLAEGFGLTVSEAMWKERAVVASRVGGIVDQIESGESGILIDDPADLDAFGATVAALLADPVESRRLGRNALTRVRDHFLGDRHLMQYGELVGSLPVAD